jgi:hypothetical protein
MLKKITYVAFSAALFAACSSNNTKKVMIVATGDINVNTDNKTITLAGGSGATDKTVEFNSSGPLTLTIKAEDGSSTPVTLNDNGFFMLNARKDTIVGAYQNYAAPKTTVDTIKQATLEKGIDSLSQLIEGKNVSAANRNFFVTPNTAVKLTANTDAFVVPPFHQMTSIEKVGDKDPEVYRFYTVNEIREQLAKLKALTAPQPAQPKK